MTDGPAPMCVFCRHYDRSGDDLACTAFPDGIPETILLSNTDHRKTYRGDHGIRFDPDPKRPPPPGYLELLFPE